MKFGVWLILLTTGSYAWAQDNYLRLYIMPSHPVRIEWDTPFTLLDSTISAGFNNRNHPISHVNVELRCAGGEPVFAGAVSRDKRQSTKLLFEENIGLSIMAGAWPGRLEDRQEILDSLSFRGQRRDMLSAVTFTVSEAACARLESYHQETVRNSATRLYGFAARPRRHEGAGCSAFAASFVEVAGLLTPGLTKAWSRTHRVPLSLMTVLGQTPAISVREAMNHPDAAAWAAGSEKPHMKITVFDPDRMHDWVARLRGSAEDRLPFGAENDDSLNSAFPKIQGLKIDAAGIPVPAEPLFEGPPEVQEVKPGFFVRKTIAFQPDGSFDLPPN